MFPHYHPGAGVELREPYGGLRPCSVDPSLTFSLPRPAGLSVASGLSRMPWELA